MTSDEAQFSGDWLDLRERADHAARSTDLATRLAQWLSGRNDLSVVDLGCGTGSNQRWLAPRLDASQRWLLVDRDSALLERALGCFAAQALGRQTVKITARQADLSSGLAALIEGCDLVTASALFDLVSEDWMKRLSSLVAEQGAAALFGLTVDGRRCLIDCDGRPIESADERQMAHWFNQHQRRSKGLGDALGPDAARRLPALLKAAGLHVWTERADWRLGAGEADTMVLGSALLDDWARAAAEQAPESASWIEAWGRERGAELMRGRVGLVVGHIDVLALPSRASPSR